MSEAKYADEIVVTQEEWGGPTRLIIDGEEFPYYTMNGYDIHVGKGEVSTVTVQIVARNVRIEEEPK